MVFGSIHDVYADNIINDRYFLHCKDFEIEILHIDTY